MLGLCSPSPRRFRRRTSSGVVLLLALATVRAGSESPTPSSHASTPPTIRDVARGGSHVGHAATGAARDASPWQAGNPVAIAVTRGHAEFDVPTPDPGSRTLVIVSAMSRAPGPFRVSLVARPTTRARPPTLVPEPTRREVRLKPVALLPPPEIARRQPAAERTFHLMVRDGDVASASNYLAVRGRLRAVGRRVQIYVDAQDLAVVGEDVLRDLMATFDDRVFPTAATTFGHARDVDGDGRFTILMSSWLTRLAGGRHAVDGYVRGADFDATLAAPFGNRCDMMYLSTALESGPHLRTVVAHEFTHAVTIGARACSAPATEGAAARSRPDEEGWLDEALAHLVEDLHGFSRSNLDYRVSAFLSQPSRYRLIVEDYYAADLFRSHGNRGGTYLFLRWCADRFGPALLPALIRSDRRGTDNLEAATGVPFPVLYRQWSVALFLSGLDPSSSRPTSPAYRTIDVRGPLGRWDLAGPRTVPVEASRGVDPHAWSTAGTSSHFVLVEGSATAGPSVAVTVEVSGPPAADLQVTAVPLPSGMARVDLDVRAIADPKGARRLHASLRERQGVAVRLDSLSWEPLVPAANPRAAGFRRDGLDSPAIARVFGSATLLAHGTLRSQAINLPDAPGIDGPLVVKVVGSDAHGRRIAAWAEVPPVRDHDGDDDKAFDRDTPRGSP